MDGWLDELYTKMDGRYASGEIPWDDKLPPPEVIELAASMKPGRALDLGSGYGRASIYLAGLGWQVDGIEFIPDAAATAANRANAAGVSARFHITSILDLGFLAGNYDLALDVGCGHNLPDAHLELYRDSLLRLLRPGGVFMMFGRLRTESSEEEDERPAGLDRDLLVSVFSQGFSLEWSAVGETEVEDKPAWPSGWFRFRAPG